MNVFTTKSCLLLTKLYNHNSQQPSYLHSCLSLQTINGTRSSSLITLSRPASSSRLKVTNRSFSHHAPVLWNNLPRKMRLLSLTTTTISSDTPLLSLASAQFHSRLKTYLFHHSYPP